MMPMVEEKPSSSARSETVRASVRVGDAAADDGVDVDVKVGVLREPDEQLGVEDLERLFETSSGMTLSMEICRWSRPAVFRRSIRSRHQVVAVGDHAGHGTGLADAGDDGVEVGCSERLAARDGDDRGAQTAQLVDAALHLGKRNGVGVVVELVAVGAGQVAAAHGHDVRHVRVRRVQQRPADAYQLTQPQGGQAGTTAQRHGPCCGLEFHARARWLGYGRH